jgi:DNA-binding winged helix-turn-helix (wHTH) protein
MKDCADKHKKPLLQFEDYVLDLEGRCLYRGDERLHLTSKPLETLIFLVENRGRVVEKQELLSAVWKGTHVTDCTLVQAVREIRRVLKDDKEAPRFIQTIPRQGYRFLPQWSLITEYRKPESENEICGVLNRQNPAATTALPATVGASRNRRLLAWVAVFALGFVFGFVFGFLL